MQKQVILNMFASLFLSLFIINLSFGEEDKKNTPVIKKLSEEDRAKVHQIMEFSGNDITKALNSPTIHIVEPLLSQVEKRNTIQINRKSMLKTDMCISHLMRSATHLSKISTGNKVTKAKVEINSTTRKISMYTPWEKRNLVDTVLKFTLFYDSDDVSPTEFACSGHKYY